METNAVMDPHLQLRGEGHGHPDPVIRGGDPVAKKIFSALRAPVWSKNRGGWAPWAFSWICHCNVLVG